MSLTRRQKGSSIGGLFDERLKASKEIIIELHFGEGGDDSKNFLDDLRDMYLAYAKAKNLKTEVLYSVYGHAVLKISGERVFEYFKHETGNHVIQRIPKNQSKGMKQTSYVSVGVLPLFDDIEYEPLPQNEIEITTMCSSIKAGGQNTNKVASSVRAAHLSTGIVVRINGRDQSSNKREAIKILTARVHEKRKEENDQEYAKIRKDVLGDGGRGDKVRTYNLLQGRIVDHRLNKKTGNIKAVMKGDLSFLTK